MAIGIRAKWPKMTQQQFDALQKQIDPETDPPAGMISAAFGPVEDGWGLLSFWQSREAFDAFQARLERAREAVGLEGVTETEEFLVYRTFSPPT